MASLSLSTKTFPPGVFTSVTMTLTDSSISFDDVSNLASVNFTPTGSSSSVSWSYQNFSTTDQPNVATVELKPPASASDQNPTGDLQVDVDDDGDTEPLPTVPEVQT